MHDFGVISITIIFIAFVLLLVFSMGQKHQGRMVKKRLFNTEGEKIFITQNYKNKVDGYIRDLEIIRHYLHEGNEYQIERKLVGLREAGLKCPKTNDECLIMIKDLKEWHV